MSILIFVIILAILILVHEFGHFITAKKSGVRADEFGIGFPPRIVKLFSWKGTDFTLNTIPFGGFVRIFGENPDEQVTEEDKKNHLAYKPKLVQALILAAGIIFNFIFAWILISVGFMHGLPTPQEGSTLPLENTHLVVTSVLPKSPAEIAGLKTGDAILKVEDSVSDLSLINPENFSNFINESKGNVTLGLSRGEEMLQIIIEPQKDIIPDKKAIGISMAMIGTLKLPPHLALIEGTKTTVSLAGAVVMGLVTFFRDIIIGHADFSQVTGPVGIVGLVGDASKLGFIYLLQFTAFISLNLAVINLLPFPALDGGRLFFLVIEAIKGSRINPKIVNTLNTLGFILLILLMVVITIKDLQKIF